MPSRKCPQCHKHLLTPTTHSTIEIDVCTHCGGLWFDKDELDKIVAEHDPDFSQETPITSSLGAPFEKGDATLFQKHCPDCNILLRTYDISKNVDLQIDVCEQCHGIWLDKGELEHAKSFHQVSEAIEAINQERTLGTWLFQFFFGLPVEFNISPREIPVVTGYLILINFLIMLGLAIAPWPDRMSFMQRFALTPDAPKTGFWFLTLLTHQFLHANWPHIIGNIYFLYILGDNVEDVLGHFRYLVFYITCGLIAGLAQTFFMLIIPSAPNTFGSDFAISVIGASGAVSGIMGAYIFFFRKAKLTFMLLFWQWKMSVLWYFGIWVAFNLIGAIARWPGIGWYAHLGGFAMGLFGAFLLYNSVVRRYPFLKYINGTQKV